MDTTAIQRALVALGYSLVVDGVMGLKTKAAVVSFQRAAGLYPDGIVGPKTILALKAAQHVDPTPAPIRQAMSAVGIRCSSGARR